MQIGVQSRSRLSVYGGFDKHMASRSFTTCESRKSGNMARTGLEGILRTGKLRRRILPLTLLKTNPSQPEESGEARKSGIR